MKQYSFENASENEEFQAILAIIDSEVDRQLSEHTRSAESLINRAALLITSSLIFVSIRKIGDGEGCWYTSALLCGLLASILGVTALFCHSKGQELKLSSLEVQLAGKSKIEAMRALTQSKCVTLGEDRARIQRKAILVTSGFAFLVISLVCTVMYSLVGG